MERIKNFIFDKARLIGVIFFGAAVSFVDFVSQFMSIIFDTTCMFFMIMLAWNLLNKKEKKTTNDNKN
jgi:purine-cytosine permease-like protein